jgi:hypothetical protein
MVVLTLAGVGRGMAAASDMAAPGFGVPGVAVHICHSGEGDGSIPGDRTHHDCCDACAISAPATLADALSLTGPASVMHYVEHAEAMTWVPTVARLRTPRQSQGPPAA